MSSGSGPTIPAGPGVPPEAEAADDAAGSPEDAPVRNATTLPPTPVLVVPAVGPASLRARRVEEEFQPRVASHPTDTPTPAGARVVLGGHGETASSADLPDDSGMGGTPEPARPAPLAVMPSLRVAPSAAITGVRAASPEPRAVEPRVRGSQSVMASPTALHGARDARFAELAPSGGGRQPMASAAYQQPAGPISKRGGSAARAADAPIAQDLFREGLFEELEAAIPPFDDHPAQVMEDVGQPYKTGYAVADPPPIPGIADRFTPPVALPTELGSRRLRSDAGGTPGPDRKERFEPTPAPSRRAAIPRLMAASPLAVAAPEPKPTRNWLWVGVGGASLGLVGLFALAGAVALVYGGSGVDADDEPPGMARRAPRSTEPEPASVEPTGAVKGPAASTTAGTLKVRANRRALVYVDDKVVAYTPLSVDLPPGTHAVSAMMPGQPNSRQSREVNVPKPGETVAVEFTF